MIVFPQPYLTLQPLPSSTFSWIFLAFFAATVPLLPASLVDALSLGGGDLDLTNPALLALLSGAGIAVPGVGGSGDEDDALIARDHLIGFFFHFGKILNQDITPFFP